MSKVSILMNGYNAQEYLKEAIDSIYSQTFKDWEIIFIDNCSIDNTKKIVDTYDEKIKYYKTDRNVSIGSARNFGLQYCTSEYLAFLDTDDIWLKNKLMQQITIMDRELEYQFCYGSVIYINELGEEIGRLIPKSKSGNVFSQQLISYEINQQAILVRNNINIQINENLTHSPDFDMFMSMASTYKGYVIPDYLVKYRKHSNSLTSKNISVWGIEMQYTLDKIFNNNPILKQNYPKEYKMAYAKVSYNKAQYFFSCGMKNKANNELSKFKFVDYKYFILYIASFFPAPVWIFLHKYK